MSLITTVVISSSPSFHLTETGLTQFARSPKAFTTRPLSPNLRVDKTPTFHCILSLYQTHSRHSTSPSPTFAIALPSPSHPLITSPDKRVGVQRLTTTPPIPPTRDRNAHKKSSNSHYHLSLLSGGYIKRFFVLLTLLLVPWKVNSPQSEPLQPKCQHSSLPPTTEQHYWPTRSKPPPLTMSNVFAFYHDGNSPSS